MSNATKHVLLVAVAAFCLGGAAYLHAEVGFSFYVLAAFVLLTVLLPLASGLYVYTNRWARFWLLVAATALLSGLVVAVDSLATYHTFKDICATLGPGHEFVVQGDDYACTAPYESDYLHSDTTSTPFSAALFWILLASLLINIVHLPYLGWRLAKNIFRFHKSKA